MKETTVLLKSLKEWFTTENPDDVEFSLQDVNKALKELNHLQYLLKDVIHDLEESAEYGADDSDMGEDGFFQARADELKKLIN